ncbi:hypothetical protein PR048_001825 [Dryococelus australis]|uniref:Uncharacterized protein n=1 Tax=Dryococelus australis TaxID=614101 RepID=A0ABQ9IJI0_9NEOP|nr:hypothetical protein PR048_001825 [Dryococelus australis]
MTHCNLSELNFMLWTYFVNTIQNTNVCFRKSSLEEVLSTKNLHFPVSTTAPPPPAIQTAAAHLVRYHFYYMTLNMLTRCNAVYKVAFHPAVVVRGDSQYVYKYETFITMNRKRQLDLDAFFLNKIKDQDEHIENMNEPKVPSVLSSSQGNDNEFDSTDPISSSNSSVVPEPIKNTKYFTTMADETTYISIKEQPASCIRYFDTTSYEIKETFFKFIDVVVVSGENIAHTILQELNRLNLDISYCHGQAYDRGSNMSGKFKGVQEHIEKGQPLAIYSHCENHRPNLTISKACSVASIRNAIGRMCETRWDENHDTVLTFFDTLPCLPVVLETISESCESRGSNVFSFLHAIQSSEFLVSVMVLAEVFWTKSSLGSELKAEYMDVLEAMKLISKIRASKSWTDSKAAVPEFSDGFDAEVLQVAEPYKDDLPCFSACKEELRSSVSTLLCPTGNNEHSGALLLDIASPENLSTDYNDLRSAKWVGFAAYPPGHRIHNEA